MVGTQQVGEICNAPKEKLGLEAVSILVGQVLSGNT